MAEAPSNLGRSVYPQCNAAPTASTWRTVAGEVIALGTGAAFASFLICSRHAALHRPNLPMQAATGFGSLLAAALALGVLITSTQPVGVPLDALVLIGLDALCVALAYVALALAPKFITAAEVSLIFLGELVLAPMWVYFRFDEVPSSWTFCGGSLLIMTMAAHEVLGIHTAAVETVAAPTLKEPFLSPQHGPQA